MVPTLERTVITDEYAYLKASITFDTSAATQLQHISKLFN
jgi:hypothetical protein